MASYLQAIMNGEYEYASLFRVNLLINFISDAVQPNIQILTVKS